MGYSAHKPMGVEMEGLAIMVLTIPIVFPMVMDMPFDPIWFGIIITLVMEMSLITPPVGVNVFIIFSLRIFFTETAHSSQCVID
jgi:C4-dicarboxylate transporter DctM subunit